MKSDWMIYGVTGHTGRLVAREAKERGLSPVLAGRDEARVRAIAEPLGFEWRAFPVERPSLSGMRAVLHCAGPFSATSRPMVDACLEARATYLDITGEIDVFESVFARSAEAKARGTALIPGVGFDVVPSDCLAARLAGALPGATRLELAFAGGSSVSRGTLKSMLEGLPQGARVRREGHIVALPWGELSTDVKFFDRTRAVTAIPWGDVSTAYFSTGIGSITAYTQVPRSTLWLLRHGRGFLDLLSRPGPRALAAGLVNRLLPDPTSGPDARGMQLWGRVTHARGERFTATLQTPEAYRFTALSAVAAVQRVLDAPIDPGAWTPSKAFGPGFVLEIPGVHLQGPEPEAG